MSFLGGDINKETKVEIKEKGDLLNEMRHERRKEEIEEIRNKKQQNTNELIKNYNETHTDKQIDTFIVPNKITYGSFKLPRGQSLEEFKQTHIFPYRSPNKLKSLYNNFEQANLLNQPTTKDIYNFVEHYNNFDVKESKEKYTLKTYSNVRYSFIGDIFFSSDQAFLLLININTRYAYGYQLGDIEIKSIKNEDEHGKQYIMKYATTGLKTTDQLINAFGEHLKNTQVNILRFDNERGIISKKFQTKLKEVNIKFIPAIPNTHTSLSIIDRLCRTLRDIAFNLNIEIKHQKILDLILNYYNNSRHETLTQTLFKAYPELKRTYPNGITPKDVNNSPELERLFVIECKKYNYYISSHHDYNLNQNQNVRVLNDTSVFEKRRTKLNKDIFKVNNRIGNIYELVNTKTNEKVYKPRYKIDNLNKF